MMYRFEINGAAFGNQVFHSQADAESYLKELISRSLDRYTRAVKAKQDRVVRALRQTTESFQEKIKIVPVSKNALNFNDVEVVESVVPAVKKVARLSSRARNYLEIG